MDGSAVSLFKQIKKFDTDPKEHKVDELCKQIENLLFMMMKQPRQAPKQAEPLCYKCGKTCPYASQCRMEREPTCYKCCKDGHRASECRSQVDIQSTCTHCHRVCHTVENCFVKRSNETVDRQDVRFAKNSETTKPKGSGPSGQNNVMFVKQDDPVEEENTVAAFKRSADGETLTNQKRMQKNIEAYTKTQVKPKIAARMNPRLLKHSQGFEEEQEERKEVCNMVLLLDFPKTM